ncbi:MAG: metalloregulator ArsR/SmtB family transcription factor [Planctomycetes bacterium]|nr:metalloregulator ArsR/SmtB family transcription factor [Planctomycetota bacterium]
MIPDIATQFARLGKALASSQRVLLLDLLAQGERPVEALASASGMSLANASQHLRVLLAAHLVANRKQGLQVHYRLAGPAVLAFLGSLQSLAECQLAEVPQAAQAHLGVTDLEPVDHRELQRRVSAGEVVVIDVRPAEEYAAGHLPGAISVPVGELRRRIAELPRTAEIMAYCRGPYCVLAASAVEELRKRGFQARRLPDGPVQWAQRRIRTESGVSPSFRAGPAARTNPRKP